MLPEIRTALRAAYDEPLPDEMPVAAQEEAMLDLMVKAVAPFIVEARAQERARIVQVLNDEGWESASFYIERDAPDES